MISLTRIAQAETSGLRHGRSRAFWWYQVVTRSRSSRGASGEGLEASPAGAGVARLRGVCVIASSCAAATSSLPACCAWLPACAWWRAWAGLPAWAWRRAGAGCGSCGCTGMLRPAPGGVDRAAPHDADEVLDLVAV